MTIQVVSDIITDFLRDNFITLLTICDMFIDEPQSYMYFAFYYGSLKQMSKRTRFNINIIIKCCLKIIDILKKTYDQ